MDLSARFTPLRPIIVLSTKRRRRRFLWQRPRRVNRRVGAPFGGLVTFVIDTHSKCPFYLVTSACLVMVLIPDSGY
ncbi:hypothetical protein E2C01_013572 [Portunus trituberculatus]|uniref:Uncharacterized protein n=1 Tax=Portunus trituberculatus TaxID=210409 RepID=A0A5B7DHM9_PORTR|nr:hypothetical protein [Portunus trituberculatus]